MSKPKLLPCPFCGGKNIQFWETDNKTHRFQIVCVGCFNGTDECISEEVAIEKWNTRKPMDDIVERLEKHKSYNQMMLKKFTKMGTIENAIYKTQRDTYENSIDIVRNAGKDGVE